MNTTVQAKPNRVPEDGYFVHERTNVASLVPAQYAKVLEVGCAEGMFRANLRADCEYWGVEPSSSAAKVAERRLHKVFNGLYDAVADQLPDAYFDVVICNDVIEHMIDHDAFLQVIKRKLAPGGRIVGSIPNVRYLENFVQMIFQRDWRYSDSGILDRTHLRFFTKKSLRRAFVENGYEVEALEGINSMWELPTDWRGRIKRALISPTMLVLGRDTLYLQFAFRVRP